ncbi:MAG: glutaredoxin family protein [Armatimonadota bacterium]
MINKDIKVYSTTTCPWCRKAKDYFNEKNINFVDINVSDDKAKLQEMINLSGQRGVPVIVIDGEVIVGFNQSKVEKLLA